MRPGLAGSRLRASSSRQPCRTHTACRGATQNGIASGSVGSLGVFDTRPYGTRRVAAPQVSVASGGVVPKASLGFAVEGSRLAAAGGGGSDGAVSWQERLCVDCPLTGAQRPAMPAGLQPSLTPVACQASCAGPALGQRARSAPRAALPGPRGCERAAALALLQACAVRLQATCGVPRKRRSPRRVARRPRREQRHLSDRPGQAIAQHGGAQAGGAGSRAQHRRHLDQLPAGAHHPPRSSEAAAMGVLPTCAHGATSAAAATHARPPHVGAQPGAKRCIIWSCTVRVPRCGNPRRRSST